ncbi:hypothetical protein HZB03_01930 [Candidatus Woesearchaeota archaeon]|nr:hypothetical protein [Candidatus Woesearchaeota archaeon]
MTILFDQFHLPKDIFEIVFSTDQQAITARMLVNEIKRNGGSLGKTEMSMFVKMLHTGTIVEVRDKKDASKLKRVTVSYSRRQFYDRILTPLKSMGIIDYDLYKKTYALSDRFNLALKELGTLWLEELKSMKR